MMVKLNMLVCLSILGFTISLFEPCDCALDKAKFKKCVKDLTVELSLTDDCKLTAKADRVKILKKMCEPSLSVVANYYIEKLNIDRSNLYEMLLKLDEGSHTYNANYDPTIDFDSLHKLIDNNFDKLRNDQLSSVSEISFNLSIKTFCKEVNTSESSHYIEDLYTSA